MLNYYPTAQWKRESYYGVVQEKAAGKVIRNIYLKTPRPVKGEAFFDAVEEIHNIMKVKS
jgi:hypothetical protein